MFTIDDCLIIKKINMDEKIFKACTKKLAVTTIKQMDKFSIRLRRM